MNDDLLPIGRFARLAGLTIGALRHYDEEGVLRPADVDPATGYRRYRSDQLSTARAIAALRDLELSLPAIRALLEADDPGTRGAILRDERARLEARTARLQRALHRLGMLSASAAASGAPAAGTGRPAEPTNRAAPSTNIASPIPHTHEEVSVPTPPPPPELVPETHRALGAGLYNRTWDLLEIEGRTPDQDDELIATAHASAWHWRQVGHAANRSRSQWLCARVYAVLGQGAPAVYHAQRCVALAEAGGEGFEDWDVPSAYESMARALAVGGDLAGAAAWKAKAAAAAAHIGGAEDRKIIEGDLATLPV